VGQEIDGGFAAELIAGGSADIAELVR